MTKNEAFEKLKLFSETFSDATLPISSVITLLEELDDVQENKFDLEMFCEKLKSRIIDAIEYIDGDYLISDFDVELRHKEITISSFEINADILNEAISNTFDNVCDSFFNDIKKDTI